jgi:predicted kinase
VTDVRAYAPRQTGTLADVIEQGPDLTRVRPAGPDSFKPTPSWSQLFTAARPAALQATPLYDDVKIGQGYAPIIEALGLPASENPGYFGALDPQGEARFGSVGSPSDLATSARRGERVPFSGQYLADRAVQESLVLDQIRARRAKDPNFLPGVPDTPDGLHSYFEQQQAQKRAAGASVLARGTGFGRFTASLAAGGLESAINDPVFLPSLLIGGGTAKTMLQAVGRDALINGVLAAGQQPILATNMAEGGEHLTFGEAATNIISGAVLGGVLGGTIHLGATHIPPALFKVMPETVQRRWAGRMRVGENGPLLRDVVGDMDNRELATFARSTLGEHMSPDEKAAADVLERAQELGEASPFMAGPAGDSAHDASLAEGLKAIIDGAPRAPSRGELLASSSLTPSPAATRPVSIGAASVPHDIVDFFRGKGLEEGQAYGIAAGISAEARGGDHTAVNPSSGAFGLGQWLGSRKAEILRRYGPNPSRQDQLEFLWHELTGGDVGGKSVLAEKDPGRVLDAYIRKFMRPKAGAETTGDLERGMSALGHRGELPESAGDVAGGDDELVAALRHDAEEADAEALAEANGRTDADADLGRSRELDAADLPILKRELFSSDRDWFEAQIEFHRSLEAEYGPQSAGNGPPAIEEGGGAPEVAQAAAAAADAPEGAVFYRGIPEGVADPFKVADRGPLGRGVYLSMQPSVAAKYGAEVIHAHVGGRIFNGRETVRMDPELEARLVSHLTADEAARYDRTRYKGGTVYPDDFLESLTRSVEPERIPEIFGAEGFSGIEANRDGHEIVVFDPASLKLARFRLADDVRIDDPELKAFDDGGAGRKDQVESIEHDLRMVAEQRAAEHLEQRFAELGPEPKRPRDFAGAVKDLLKKRSAQKGIAYRLSAEDAVRLGVPADEIFADPKARYPKVKIQLAGIFASSKAPLRSRARSVVLRSLDWLGDRVDPEAFGITRLEGETRIEPEEIADLLRASIEKSNDALDRSDPEFEHYSTWWQRHNSLMALEGEPAHPITGETLPEVEQRAEALRDSFPPAEPGGTPGTHNIGNSEAAPEGGTRGELRVQVFNALMAKPARAEHEAHLVLGPPAAGKSSVAEPLAAATGSRLIDADEAKAMLPEFEDGVGAHAVHEESARLAAVAADATIRKGENIVLPLVGRTYASAAARIQDLLDAGYNVHLHLVDLPGEKAVQRAIARFSETGRFVPPEYVRSIGNAPKETFTRLVEQFKDQLGGHVHVSNDVPIGEKPQLVEASSQELAARLGYDRGGEPGEGARAPQGGSGSDTGGSAQESVPGLERRYQLADDREPQTLAEILAELDADRAAVDALKACAAPRGAA